MGKNIYKYKGKIIMLVLPALILFYGCSGSEGKEEQNRAKQQSTEQKAEKIPDQLKEIETSIEDIIAKLNGPSVSEEGKDKDTSQKEEEKGGAAEGQEGKDQEGSSQEKGEQKQEGQDKEQAESEQGQKQQEGQSKQGQEEKKDQEQKDKNPEEMLWQDIRSIIDKLHYKWNGYMPDAVKKGANRELIDNFSDALNKLTDSLREKNVNKTLLVASELYSCIPDFFGIYRTSNSPDIKRIRHFARSVVLSSKTGDWEHAAQYMENLKDTWDIYKNSIGKEMENISGKLDFSIYELNKVISEKNQELTDIKGRIAISNISELEKALEKGKGQEQGQGQDSGQ